MENKAHPHAELMRLYAEDAAETDRPWERWEAFVDANDEWFPLDMHPYWVPGKKYRRKPRVRSLNGFEYPEPEVDAPENGEVYWFPQLGSGESLTCIYEWNSDSDDFFLLNCGLVHLTKEAAEAHARAIILAGGGVV